MKRKTLSLLLAAMMILMVLAACGSTPTADPTPTPTPSSPASTDPAATPDTPSEPTPTPKPEYSEITVEVFDRGNVGGTDPTNNYYTDWIKQKCLEDLNLGVTFFAVSRWDEEPMLTNLMAAKTAPDISFTYNPSLIAGFGNQGGLHDLMPYVDLMPDLRAFLGDELFFRDKSADTGMMYDIPGRRMQVAKVGTFIRKDWLDKLGMPLPTTTDEYYNALKAFKEQDPGGVGKNKVIPLTLTNDTAWRAGPLLASFIDPNLTRKEKYSNFVNNSEIMMPGYKEGVRLLNKMFNEGLIDPEFTLYKSDDISDDAIKRGEVGSFMHNWDQPYRESPGLLKDLAANVPGAEIVPINPFKNSAGSTGRSLYDQAGNRSLVPIFSKNPAGACRYLNWLAIFENRYYLQIGDEGVTHVLQDGIPKVIETTGEKVMNSANNIDYTLVINGMDHGSPELNGKALSYGYNTGSEYIEDAFAYAVTDGFEYPIMSGIQILSEGPVAVDLSEKAKTLFSQAITCTPDQFDKIWDDGVANYKTSGFDAAFNERMAKYFE